MMNKQLIKDFLEKYSNNRHTEQEHQQFISWLETAPVALVNQVLEDYQDIMEMQKEQEPAQYSQLINDIEARLNDFDNNNKPVHKTIELWTRWKYIASVAAVIVAVFAIYLGINHRKENSILVKNKPDLEKEAIQPGGNNAILTLADGSRIVLEQAEDGLISVDGGSNIMKTASGQIMYEASNSNETRDIVYNTITTPKGGQYHIVLSDGSKVWLNAASTLKFPASFSGKERRVELTGEAYFEIAKVSSHRSAGKFSKPLPFKVTSHNQTVEVLGTHFNINAYTEELSANTTLIEGSVRVSQNKTGNSKILKPGQQAKVDNAILVTEVDAAQAIAWKNGYFSFSQESIESVMRKISRWYDVDIQFEGTPTREVFSGSVSRFKEISEILYHLELTGTVHFKTVRYKEQSGKEGRRIIVMP